MKVGEDVNRFSRPQRYEDENIDFSADDSRQ